MQSKILNDLEVAAAAGPFDYDLHIRNFKDFAIQLIHGANAGVDVDLYFSNDGENFTIDPAATRTLNTLADSEIWDIYGNSTEYVRVSVPAGVTASLVFKLGVL